MKPGALSAPGQLLKGSLFGRSHIAKKINIHFDNSIIYNFVLISESELSLHFNFHLEQPVKSITIDVCVRVQERHLLATIVVGILVGATEQLSVFM